MIKASSNKCIATSNKCLTSSNKKLLGAEGNCRNSVSPYLREAMDEPVHSRVLRPLTAPRNCTWHLVSSSKHCYY